MAEQALGVQEPLHLTPSVERPIVPQRRSMEHHPAWPLLSTMPMHLSVALPIAGFCIGSLLSLKPGDLLETRHAVSDDVPLIASRVRIAMGEFEVIEDHLSLRVTHLA